MAEPISIQQLKDASLDAKTLEEAVNGDSVTTVLSRLGETYPTLSNALNQIDSKLDSADTQIKQGITNLFESGGLPATPFATKALMTASALVDGKYAMVTNDTVNNGLYVKTAGAWVKSSYDPLVESKSYTDSAIAAASNKAISTFSTLSLLTASPLTEGSFGLVVNDIDPNKNGHYQKISGVWTYLKYNLRTSSGGNSTYPWVSTNQGTVQSGYVNYVGALTASPKFVTSDFIAVSKGDCFVLSELIGTTTTERINSFSLYDESKAYVGSIGQGLSNVLKTSSSDSKLKLRVGVYSNESELSKMAAIVPRNGFIKVSYDNSSPTKPVTLHKTDYEGFIDNSLIQLPRDDMRSFKGVYESVVMDKDFLDMGFGVASAQVGNPILPANIKNSVSIKYPVKKGQYVNLHTCNASNTAVSIVAEDAQGNYLGVIEVITPTSLGGASEGKAYVNCVSEHTGFIRVQHDHSVNVPCLLAITDESVVVSTTYIKKGEKISFYSNGTGVASGLAGSSLSVSSWVGYSRESILDDNVLSRSIPYLLKKGEVLEYGIKATIDPTMFLAMPNRLDGGKSFNTEFALLSVNAIEILDLENKGSQHLLDPVTNNIYVGDAQSGKGAYCNEYEDTIIVFLRPRTGSTNYNKFKCDNRYTLDVLSKSDYIKKRDEELVSRFKTLSKYTTNLSATTLAASYTGGSAALNTHGSYSGVLLFKGEVLNCLTGSRTIVKGDRLRNAKNPTEASSVKIFGTDKSVLHTAYHSGINLLPMKKSDENSYNHTQVYAQETCIVYVSFSALSADNVTPLDIDGMIKNSYFKPRIVPLEDVVVNENIMPTLVRGIMFYLRATYDLSSSYVDHSDAYITFAPKGTNLEYGHWVTSNNHRAFFAPIATTEGVSSNGLPPAIDFNYIRDAGDKDTGYNLAGVRNNQVTIADVLSTDSMVILGTGTRVRAAGSIRNLDTYDSVEANSVKPIILETDSDDVARTKLMQQRNVNVFVKSISDAEYDKKYKVTDLTYFKIPDISGVYFNFCEVVSPSLEVEYMSVLQIKRNDEVLLVVNAITANQGQSTAGLVRKNINIELLNSEGEDLNLAFGNNIPQSEFVLKTYIASDRGMFKDNLSADTWLGIRRALPYPLDSVLPVEVFNDTRFPENQLAKGTTFGFPTEVHIGGSFYSMSSIRNKKKRDNYAMQKDNQKHILMNPDAAYMGAFSWSDGKIGNFKIRNPKMSGYTEGDMTLPVKYQEVEDSISRFLAWARGIETGAIDLRSTYKDYIDLDSFIDYAISINLMSHWDSQTNNFVLGTHDGKVWRVYFYDGDQTWGSLGGYSQLVSPVPITLTQASLFKTVFEAFTKETKRRYGKLRNIGAINVLKHQKAIMDYSDRISPEARILERDYWGETPVGATAPYTMRWANSRVKVLDIYYEYKDPTRNIVVQALLPVTDFITNIPKKFTYTNTNTVLGDELSVDTPYTGKDLKIEAEVTSNGTVVMTITNTSPSVVTFATNYINIIKEDKYVG